MNANEWILAGGEVLFDDAPDGLACHAVQSLANKVGVSAILEALRDAADAASDHLGEGNGGCDAGPADEETVAKINKFRIAMRDAIEAVKS